mmetsp:Transcript_42724/g.100512  ORF Transcript_42724/g.100512 Transcript_42724/m.100512 type:complete len:276 (+) Transcript_42724:775-1602(+)
MSKALSRYLSSRRRRASDAPCITSRRCPFSVASVGGWRRAWTWPRRLVSMEATPRPNGWQRGWFWPWLRGVLRAASTVSVASWATQTQDLEPQTTSCAASLRVVFNSRRRPTSTGTWTWSLSTTLLRSSSRSLSTPLPPLLPFTSPTPTPCIFATCLHGCSLSGSPLSRRCTRHGANCSSTRARRAQTTHCCPSSLRLRKRRSTWGVSLRPRRSMTHSSWLCSSNVDLGCGVLTLTKSFSRRTWENGSRRAFLSFQKSHQPWQTKWCLRWMVKPL